MPMKFTDIPATEPDPPMKYEVVPPTDEEGNPEAASPQEKAAATRLAKRLDAETEES